MGTNRIGARTMDETWKWIFFLKQKIKAMANDARASTLLLGSSGNDYVGAVVGRTLCCPFVHEPTAESPIRAETKAG